MADSVPKLEKNCQTTKLRLRYTVWTLYVLLSAASFAGGVLSTQTVVRESLDASVELPYLLIYGQIKPVELLSEDTLQDETLSCISMGVAFTGQVDTQVARLCFSSADSLPFAFPVRAPAAGLSAPHLATLTATQQLNVTAYQPADATEISGGGKFTIALVQWKRLLAIDSMTKRLSIDLTSEGVQESSIELTELQQPLTTEEETGDLGSIESLDTVKFAEAADDSGPPESASSSAAKSASQHTADVTQPVLIEAFWNQSPFFSAAILQTPSTEEAVRLVLAVGCTALLMLLVARSRRRPTEGSPVEHIQTKLDQQLLAQSLVPRSQQIIATPEGCSTHSPRNSKTATASRGRRSPLKSTPEQQLMQEQPLVQEKPRCRWTGDRSGVHTMDVHSSSTFRTSQLWNRDGKGRLTRGPEFDSAHKGDERTVSESVF